MQSIIRFLNTKEESLSRRNLLIPRIINVYGNVMNKQNIAKCYRDFNTERKMKHFFFIMKFRSFRTKITWHVNRSCQVLIRSFQ